MLCTGLSACISMPLFNQADSTAPAANKPAVMAPAGYNNAISSAKAGNSADAIAQFKEIAATNPDFYNSYTNLGLLYMQTDNSKEAEQAFQKALSLNNKDAVSYNHLGILLRKQGKFTEAQAMYQKAITVKPDYADACLNLGILYDLYLQDFPNALIQYNTHQMLTGNQDKVVEKWIIDLNNRILAMSKNPS